MKQIWIVFAVLFMVACKSSDKKKTGTETTGTSLEQRLSYFMKANDNMDIEKVLDYTYPKLFEIVPRAQLLQFMKDGFNNKEVKVEMDSLTVDKVYPVFEEGKGNYAKVIYSMVMIMTFTKDSAQGNSDETNEMIRATMAEKYGENNVNLDKATGVLRIRQTSPMIAAKDEHSKEWTFVNLKEGDATINKMFSKEVLDKLATYN
ncbi:MAG TPA: hypothetical protein VGO58_00770 [Chitinophagaceae bacterium]|nr:hypothetical protein [Chitinophagaceae bacterium]